MCGFVMEALKQIEEARRCENTGKLDIVGCCMINLSGIVIIPGFCFELAVGSDGSA